jgi:hypothetical protein
LDLDYIRLVLRHASLRAKPYRGLHPHKKKSLNLHSSNFDTTVVQLETLAGSCCDSETIDASILIHYNHDDATVAEGSIYESVTSWTAESRGICFEWWFHSTKWQK